MEKPNRNENNRKIIMSIRISHETFQKLQDLARKEKKTYSRKAREIIEEYITDVRKEKNIVETVEVPREIFNLMIENTQATTEMNSALITLFKRFSVWHRGYAIEEEEKNEDNIKPLNDFVNEIVPDVTVSVREVYRKKLKVVALSSNNKKILTNVLAFYITALKNIIKVQYKIISKESNKVFIRINT